MTTFSKYLEENSLFEELASLNPNVFNFMTVEEMEFTSVVHYGNRIVSNAFESADSILVAKLIDKLYSEKWNKLVALQLTELDMLYGSKFIEEITSSKDEDKTSDTTNINQSSAIDDTNLITESGSESNLISNNTITGNESRKSGEVSLNNLLSNLHDYQKVNIINQVLSDIANYLCLSVY